MAYPWRLFNDDALLLWPWYDNAGQELMRWCVRCETWLPVTETFSLAGQGARSRHHEDHLEVYEALQTIGHSGTRGTPGN
jgi:hypothetical protein